MIYYLISAIRKDLPQQRQQQLQQRQQQLQQRMRSPRALYPGKDMLAMFDNTIFEVEKCLLLSLDSTNRHFLPRELYFIVRHRETCLVRKILKGNCRCPRWRKGQRWHKRAKKCRCTKRRRWDRDEKTCVCRDADRQGYLWDLQRDLKFKILSINDLLNAERTRKTYC